MSNNNPIDSWYKKSRKDVHPKKYPIGQILSIIWFFACIIGLIIFTIVNDDGIDETKLTVLSREAVESHLKYNPNDAKFSNETFYGRDKLDNLFDEDERGNTHYAAVGNVEVTNGFGAREKVPFVVEFNEDEEVISVTIDDNLYEW